MRTTDRFGAVMLRSWKGTPFGIGCRLVKQTHDDFLLDCTDDLHHGERPTSDATSKLGQMGV